MTEWMPTPTRDPSCPPGLEYLSTIDQIFVQQKVEMIEVCTRFHEKNRYHVKNSLDEFVYKAIEETNCLTRNILGACRPFTLKVKTKEETVVIQMKRYLRCSICCFPCCLQRLDVMSPPGTLIGKVVEELTFCRPAYRIENERGETVFRIRGPLCFCSMFCETEFMVLSKNYEKVGKISKTWSGLLKETFTRADNYGINFPMDADVKMKATLLGALFLLDFMYFE